MTRKEAIEFLKNMIDRESIGFVCPKGDGDVAVWEYHVTALNMAIKALEQPEPCEDAVSKADVLETYADLYDVFEDNKQISKELHKVYDKLNALPSAQPTYTDEEIQKMQDLESAQIEKAYQLGYEEGKKDAWPERKKGKWLELTNTSHTYMFGMRKNVGKHY